MKRLVKVIVLGSLLLTAILVVAGCQSRESGDRVIFGDDIRAALEGGVKEADLEPRSAPAYLASMVAKELGGKVAIQNCDDKAISLSATFKANA